MAGDHVGYVPEEVKKAIPSDTELDAIMRENSGLLKVVEGKAKKTEVGNYTKKELGNWEEGTDEILPTEKTMDKDGDVEIKKVVNG